ncbi:TonB-dependent receptor [Flavisphingomonas formosensis]|uniref:TonB-dependent receptor n=1 Tax=Flavisphingomonas formosensis TaxID=861534 RepID=UPI0012FA2DA0|nr:TonB-dependent receptor [Sphingomonas formosensis]
MIRRNRNNLRRTAAVAGLIALITLHPHPSSGQATIEFHIAAGSLAQALDRFGSVTGRQLLYPSALVAGHKVDRLDADLTPEAALGRLLAGSGIGARFPASGVVVLYALPADRKPVPAPPPVRPRPAVRPADPTPAAIEKQDIVVTGSNIRGRREGASPLVTLDRDLIDRRGFGSIAQAVQSLPQNFGGTATEATALAGTDRTSFNDGIGSGVNLRGLGSNATLTLINGRRVAGSGAKGDFTDLSLIPSVALERIEVLADGASALYGADAVGGVVNVRLRTRYDGAESRMRLGSVTKGGAREIQLGQLAGTHWSSGQIVLAYEYYHRGALAAASRRFAGSADLRPLGGSDFRSSYAVPGTLLGYDPALGTYVPSYGIPDGQDGTALGPGDFHAGGNLGNQLEGSDLLPRQTRHSLYLHAEQQLGTALTLYGEGHYAHRSFSYAGAPSLALMMVTPANPWFVSPTGSASDLIAYSFARELGPVRTRGTVEAYTLTGGAKLDLGHDWRIDLSYSRGHSATDNRSDRIVNTTRLDEALGNTPIPAGSDYDPARDGYFNPFGSGTSNGAALLDYIGGGYSTERLRNRLDTATLALDGPLVRLPAGAVRIALGTSWRREHFLRGGENFYTGDTPTPLTESRGSRSMEALYAELSVPLFGPDNALPGLHQLLLSAAVRHEHYSDFGSTTNPKLGLVWEPVEGLALKASYGTSFRAPALPEINDPVRISATQLPNSAGSYTPVLFLTGGNRDLEPEKARSLTLGMRVAPPRTGFSGELTFFRTRFANQIGRPAYENILAALTDPTLAPFVSAVHPATSPEDLARVEALIADPGSIVPANYPPSLFQAIVDSRYVNTAELIVRGLDLALSKTVALGDGQLGLSGAASWLLAYKQRLTPTAALIDKVDLVGYPAAFRGHVTADWSEGPWGASATVNHVGGMRDTVSVPARHVGSWTTLDLQLRVQPRWRGLASGLTLALSAQNLLDSDPPFVNRASPLGYDPANANALGRFVSLQLTKAW